MYSRFLPVLNQCLKLTGRARDLKSLAVDVSVVAPEETVPTVPVLFLKSQLEKAKATSRGFSTLADQLSLVTATEVKHTAVIRYTFRNCLVHDAGFEVLGGSFRKKKLHSKHFLIDRVMSLHKALYCMTNVSHRFFGHWLHDACPTALLAQPGESLLLDVRADWPHTSEYLDAFSLAPVEGRLHHAETLTIYQDFGQGSSKCRRLNEMRYRLQKAFSHSAAHSQAVYFRRGHSGVSRVIANEDEITSGLSRNGFDIFDIEGASIGDIYARTRGARVVVSMEGSHIRHLYFSLEPGSTLILLVPADRFVMIHRGLAQASGLHFGFVVIDPVDGGYKVCMKDLYDTLDMIRWPA